MVSSGSPPFGPRCQDCGRETWPDTPGVWRKVEGWVQKRKDSGGGTHAISKSRDLGPVVCALCWAERELGGQESLPLN